jgi:hypothetical protein
MGQEETTTVTALEPQPKAGEDEIMKEMELEAVTEVPQDRGDQVTEVQEDKVSEQTTISSARVSDELETTTPAAGEAAPLTEAAGQEELTTGSPIETTMATASTRAEPKKISIADILIRSTTTEAMVPEKTDMTTAAPVGEEDQTEETTEFMYPMTLEDGGKIEEAESVTEDEGESHTVKAEAGAESRVEAEEESHTVRADTEDLKQEAIQRQQDKPPL